MSTYFTRIKVYLIPNLNYSTKTHEKLNNAYVKVSFEHQPSKINLSCLKLLNISYTIRLLNARDKFLAYLLWFW